MAKRHKLSKSSLHWFIKSRPYVLIPELRRRFDLDGTDDVHAIGTAEGRAYIGLPERAARFIEDLVRENRLGLEFVPDLSGRMVQGLFAFDLLRQQTGLVIAPSRAPMPAEVGDPDEAPDGDASTGEPGAGVPQSIETSNFQRDQSRQRPAFPPRRPGLRDSAPRPDSRPAAPPPAELLADARASEGPGASRWPRRGRRGRPDRPRMTGSDQPQGEHPPPSDTR